MYPVDCRHFNGYKPCAKHETCAKSCPHYSKVESTILLVHFGALGAVVRSTALLKSIRQKHPQAYLIWMTEKPADKLLMNHPDIDLVLSLDLNAILRLKSLQIDTAYVVDKDPRACGLLDDLNILQSKGFRSHPKNAGILPANASAHELWELGLDNHKKFHINKKSELELLLQALELPTATEPTYNLPLSEKEMQLKFARVQQWRKNPSQVILGFNTGCANTIPAKKWTVEYHIQVIKECLAQGFENIVLLGGPEDIERNTQIHRQVPQTILSPMDLGLRDGLVSVAACDVVVSGDSLGMHMAISQGCYTVAWFGPTVAAEIDLFGRGEKLSVEMSCSPCWKRLCNQPNMCYDSIAVEKVLSSIHRGVVHWQKESYLYRPPFLAMPSSV